MTVYSTIIADTISGAATFSAVRRRVAAGVRFEAAESRAATESKLAKIAAESGGAARRVQYEAV